MGTRFVRAASHTVHPMAAVPAMLRLTLVALLAAWGQCAHEWHRKLVGAVQHAALDGRHVLVSTASGVLASLDSRSGGVGASPLL